MSKTFDISFRSPLDERIFLNALNGGLSAEELSAIVEDDPLFGAARGRGLSVATAGKILKYKKRLPAKYYRKPEDLTRVSNVGQDTIHDLVTSFSRLSIDRKVLLFINSEKNPQIFSKLLPGITATAVKAILNYRKATAGEGIGTIDELVAADVIPAEAWEKIRSNFINYQRLAAARDRLDLSVKLKQFISTGDGTALLRGDTTLQNAIAKLYEAIPRKDAEAVGEIYQNGLGSGAVTPEERIADVIHIPVIADHVKPAPPVEIMDPASIPDISSGYSWLRSTGGVVLEPNGEGLLEVLTPQGWTRGLTVVDRIYIEPVQEGLVVRTGGGGLMSAVGRTQMLIDAPAPAVRLTCQGGVMGMILGKTYDLSLANDARDIIPPDWGLPDEEIWINPLPGMPPIKKRPPKAPGRLPTGVVVGGGACPPGEEEEGGTDGEQTPSVLIAVGPQIFIKGTPGFTWPGIPGLPPPGPPPAGGKKGKGWGWGPVVFVPPAGGGDLSVVPKGCQCIRRPEISEYTAEPSIDGGDYEWSVDDDKIAAIEGPKNQKKCKLKSKKIGKITLTVKYTLNGATVQAAMGVAVIYQRFTQRNRPRSEKSALPVVHPYPKIRINPQDSWPVTVGDVEVENHRAKFYLDIKGTLKDALVDIRGVEVSAGRDFKRKLPRGANQYGGFNDDAFHAEKIRLWGPGRNYVRVKASNSIEDDKIAGTDTLEVVIKIPQRWESIITGLETSKQLFIASGAGQAEIDAYDVRLKQAWDSALRDVAYEFGYLEHSENTVRRVPGNEKWSIAVEADDTSGAAEIVTSRESRTIDLEEKAKKLLAPKNKPKNYFLIHDKYARERVKWDPDGRLKHTSGEPVALVYMGPCCGHDGPGIGVELDSPGVNFIKKDEGIGIVAHGKPREFKGVPGRYIFKCIARPKSAKVRFDPATMPTLSNTVKFFTDTPGVYTFKVEYQLLDASGPWTYALADGQVIFEVDTVASISRLGRFDGDIVNQKTVPTYQVRSVKERRAAEVKVREATGGPLGQDLEFRVLCPPEVFFLDTLQAKVIYTDDTDRDFKVHVDQKNRFLARLIVRSAIPIKEVIFFGIQYGNLQRNIGDAVWFDVLARPLEPAIVDLEGPAAVSTRPASATAPVTDSGTTATTAAPAAAGSASATSPSAIPTAAAPLNNTVAVLVGDDQNGFHEEEIELSKPLVNMILRTRDLGPAAASKGIISLAPIISESNITNGNHFFDVLLFSMTGAGMNLSPSIHYNSKSATRAQAIRLYGLLNGKNQDKLDEEFGREYFADGWGASFHTQLFPFVEPDGDFDRPRLKKCVEVLHINGNRIVFEEEGFPGGKYKVQWEGECIGDSPNAALGMTLTWNAQKEEWTLEDAVLGRWIYDKNGLIKERSTAASRASHNKLKPLVWRWTDTAVYIKDSVRREINITLDARKKVKQIEAPNKAKFELVPQSRYQLKEIKMPREITWQFEQEEKFSLLDRIIPPVGHKVELFYYRGAAFEDVPQATAREYWGRVGKQKFGDREHKILNQDLQKNESRPQQVICVDPAGFKWRYTYDTLRQAVQRIEVAGPGSAAGWKTTMQVVDYYMDTKLVRRSKEINGAEVYYSYAFSPRSQAKPLLAVTEPNQSMRNYKFYDNDLIEKFTDELNQEINYKYYDDDLLLKTIAYPQVIVYSPGLQRITVKPTEEYKYDDKKRIQEHTSVDGVKTAYVYDPNDKSGQATEITTGTHKRTITYDIMGDVKSETNHLGLTTSYNYDEFGRIEDVTTGSKKLIYEYDKLNRVTKVTDGLGRYTQTRFNDYGEIEWIRNQRGDKKELLEYDQRGILLKEKNEDGGISVYSEIDALGRWKRQKLPQVAETGLNNLATANMADVVREFVDDPRPLTLTGEQTTREIITAGNRKLTTHFNLKGHVVAKETEAHGRLHAVVFKFNRRGNVIEKQIYENGQLKASNEQVEYDVLGRPYKKIIGGVPIYETIWHDQEGMYQVELMPSQTRQEGRRPSTVTRLDPNYRPVKIFDGDGHLILEHKYTDSERKCEVWAADPLQEDAGAPLRHTLTITFNQEGKVVERRDVRVNKKIKNIYDGYGRVEKTETPLGAITYSYDAMDRIEKKSMPVPGAGGSVTPSGLNPPAPTVTSKTVAEETRYDAMGRVTYQGTALTNVSHKYDKLGRIRETTRRGIGVRGTLTEKHYYNEFGERVAAWIEPGYYHKFEHDFKANKTTETVYHNYRRRGRRVIEFDPLGKPRRVTEAQSQDMQCNLDYDAGGRLKSYVLKWAGREIAKVAYDYYRGVKPNEVTLSYDNRARRIFYTYNSNLMVSKISDSDLSYNGDYTFKYNKAGLKTEMGRWVDAKAKTTFKYHPNAVLAEMKHVLGENWEKTFTTKIAANAYDWQGNPKTIKHTFLDEGDPDAKEDFLQEESHKYDDTNRVIESEYRGLNEGIFFDYFDDKTKQKRNFYYDEHGRKVVEFVRMTPDTDSPGEQIFEIVTQKYGAGSAVDEEIREFYLVGQTTPNYLRKKFLYDEIGRRSHTVETLIRSGSDAGTWARITEYKYAVQMQPRQIRIFEMRGNKSYLISDTDYGYDLFDKMVFSSQRRYYESEFGQAEHNPVLAGTYAGLSDFENAPTATLLASGSTNLFYIYAGDDLVAVLDGDGKPLQEYLNGPGANHRLALKQNKKVFDYYLDHRGASLALSRADGAIDKTFKQFGTWGEFQEQRKEAVHGGNWEDPTGLMQSGGRKYDPNSGIFIAPDPLGLRGGANLYQFAGGNPINNTDQNGKLAVLGVISLGLALSWVGWEIYSWYAAASTGDPAHETSPSFRIIHGCRGKSIFGGPGSGFDRFNYEDDYGARAWDIFVGGLSILGFILPLFHAAKLLSASGNLSWYGRLLILDAAGNMGAGVVETARGHYILGPAQSFLGAVGLGYFRSALRTARQGFITVPDGARALQDLEFENQILNNSRNAATRLGVDVVEPVPRAPITQYNDVVCAPTSAGMILRTLGYTIDRDSIELIWRAVNCELRGTRTEDIFEMYRKLVPNARFVPAGKLTIKELAQAVENGHPVHVGWGHPTMGHAVVVDGVERGWFGRIKRFYVRDPSGVAFGRILSEGSGAAPRGVSRTVDASGLDFLLPLSDFILTNPSRWVPL